MEHVLEFHETVPEAEVVASGRTDVPGLVAIFEAVVCDPRYHPGMTILFDLTALDSSSLTAPELREFAELTARYAAELGDILCAEVNQKPYGYGFGRMFEVFTEQDRSLRYRVFYDREDAVAWLTSERGR